MKKIRIGNLRVTKPFENVYRIEYSKTGTFTDKGTLFCPGIKDASPLDFAGSSDEESLQIYDGEIRIHVKKAEGFYGVKVYQGRKEIYSFKEIINSGEIPFPKDTPMVFPLLDAPKIYLNENGYKPLPGVKNNGFTFDEENSDLYLILCLGDPTSLRKGYIAVTGPTEMVPFSAIGAWDSKYFEYTDATIKEEIDLYHKYGLPLDNFVIDTDWRVNDNNGAGYSVNTNDFPDIEATFASIHAEKLQVMFNDHPEPVEGAENAFDPLEVAYREKNLRTLLEKGLDYWWYDRNWWTRLKSPVKGLTSETVGYYLYDDVARSYNALHKAPSGYPKRTLMMGNVDQIFNGTYIGITNSASHRYVIQWTGDTSMAAESLSQEMIDMLKAGNNLITYISSDISGHFGDGDDDLYTRWLEHGALSPILRLHSTKGQKRYRQPWLYGKKALKHAKDLYGLRYSLLPLYYALSHHSYLDGTPISATPDFYGDKDYDLSKGRTAMLGPSLLYSVPIPENDTLPLPKGSLDLEVSYFKNTKCKGEPVLVKKQKSLDFVTKPDESLMPELLPAENWSLIAKGTIKGGKEDYRLVVGSDDGVRVYLDGKLVLNSWVERGFSLDAGPIIKAGSEHTILIKYFQAAGGAGLSLRFQKLEEKLDPVKYYLPHGEWIDLFDGSLIKAPAHGRKMAGKCPFGVFPFYVKAGSIIVKGEVEERAVSQIWDRIYVDIFPAAHEHSFVLYEDDRVSEAYKDGYFRETTFKGEKVKGTYELTVSKAEGKGYYGDDQYRERQATFRFHLREGFKVEKVLMDGQELPFKKIAKKKGAFPLANHGGVPDASLIEVEAVLPLDQEKKLIFLLA